MSNILVKLSATGLVLSLALLTSSAMAQDRPAAAFCLPADSTERQACVALFLDEDGYEVCLSDRQAGTDRCFSHYRIPDRQPHEPEREPDILLGSTVPEPLRI